MDPIKELIDEVEPTKLTRIKTKIKDNKREIIAVAIGLVTGAAAAYLLTKKSDDEIMVEGSVAFLNTITGYKPIINNNDNRTTIINEVPATRLSYLVKVGDKIYETQREAAEALGVSESNLSKFFNGKTELGLEETPIRLGVRT
jgi:hypothetical protein